MAIKVHKFRDTVEMETTLRGGLIGTDVSRGVVGLVGQQISFTAPAGSHTFVTANRPDDALLLTDIKTQLEAALGGGNIRVFSIGGRIAFIHPTAASAIALAATSQQAKVLLGFDLNSASAGKLYGADPVTPPAIVTAYCSGDNSHVVVTNE